MGGYGYEPALHYANLPIVGFFSDYINRLTWMKIIQNGPGSPLYLTVQNMAISPNGKYVAFQSNGALTDAIHKIDSLTGELIYTCMYYGGNTWVHPAYFESIAFDKRDYMYAGFQSGVTSGNNDMTIVQCNGPGVVSPSPYQIIYATSYASYAGTIDYVEQLDQIIVGAKLDGSTIGYSYQTQSISLWDASSLNLVKCMFHDLNNFNSNAQVYNFDISAMFVNYPYYAGCMCDVSYMIPSYFGIIAYNMVDDSAMIQSYYDSSYYILCQGAYINAVTKQMQVVFSKQLGPLTLFLGTITDAFPASPYSMTMTVTQLDSGSLQFYPKHAAFVGLNDYYVAGYVSPGALYQGYMYASKASKSCFAFTVTNTYTQPLTYVTNTLVSRSYATPSTDLMYNNLYIFYFVSLSIQVSNTHCGIPGQILITAPTPTNKICHTNLECSYQIGQYVPFQACTDSPFPQLSFQLVEKSTKLPLSVPYSVTSTNNSPTISFSPTIANLGTWVVEVQATYFNNYLNNTDYFFTLYVESPYCWNRQTYTMMSVSNKVFWTNGGTPLSFTIIPVDICYENVTFTAYELSGTSLPYFMSFTSSNNSFYVYTSDPSDTFTYTIKLDAIFASNVVGTLSFSIDVKSPAPQIAGMSILAPSIASTSLNAYIQCPWSLNVGQYCVFGQPSNCQNEQMTLSGSHNSTAIDGNPSFPIVFASTLNYVSMSMDPPISLVDTIHQIVINAILKRQPQVVENSNQFSLSISYPKITVPVLAVTLNLCFYPGSCTISIGAFSMTAGCPQTLDYNFTSNGDIISALNYSQYQMDIVNTNNVVSFLFTPSINQIGNSFDIVVMPFLLELPEVTDNSTKFKITVIPDCTKQKFIFTPAIDDIQYQVGSGKYTFSFEPFLLNFDGCGPIVYIALVNGVENSALLFSGDLQYNQQVTIETDDSKFVGNYYVTIAAQVFNSGNKIYTFSPFFLSIFNSSFGIALQQGVLQYQDQSIMTDVLAKYSLASTLSQFVFGVSFQFTFDFGLAFNFTSFDSTTLEFQFRPNDFDAGEYQISGKGVNPEQTLLKFNIKFKLIVESSKNQSVNDGASDYPNSTSTVPKSQNNVFEVKYPDLAQIPIKAIVYKLTSSGLLAIRFNQSIDSTQSYLEWTQENLEITLTKVNEYTPQTSRVNYTIQSLAANNMVVQLYFDDPTGISYSEVKIMHYLLGLGHSDCRVS